METERKIVAESRVVTTLQLKQLLVLLLDNPQADICIRIRRMGEMWRPNFMRVLVLTGNGVILNDEVERRAYSITYLTEIIQFEIDGKIQGYQPHFHYEVRNVTEQ